MGRIHINLRLQYKKSWLVLVELVSLDQLARYLTFQTDSQSRSAPSPDFTDVRQVTGHTMKLIDLTKTVEQDGRV